MDADSTSETASDEREQPPESGQGQSDESSRLYYSNYIKPM